VSADLGRAILLQALTDARDRGAASGRRAVAAQARAWLNSDSFGLQLWCDWCGTTPDRVRRLMR